MAGKEDKTEMVGPGAPPPADRTLLPSEADTEPSVPPDSDPGMSDVRLAPDSSVGSDPKVEETLDAPTFRAPTPKREGPREFALQAGDRIADFEVIETLGRGAFGTVYLARQMSLDRRVALKVTANRGSEGRTMARLEHDHVVQVFSESVDDTGAFRLLCMQLVPGASLEAVIRALVQVANERGHWTGADYLAAIDDRTKVRETFDPSALRDRELLSEASDVEAAAWVGARMAEAVNFAHANQVLHRDIKPANVLINQYGRPLLADFNISFRGAQEAGDGGDDKDTSFGGTLAFMAPEHLDAFDPTGHATADDVDERSDIYSLGMVVYELLVGKSPFQDPKRVESRNRFVGRLAKWRREAPAPIDAGPPTARKVLQHTVAKALAPEKEDRYQSGEQFAAALDGCRHLAKVERESPAAGSFAASVIRYPLIWAGILIFLPQVVGSIVNIAYNQNQIIDLLNEEQRAIFPRLVMWYNVVVYPLGLATLAYFFLPVLKTWRAMQQSDRLDPVRVSEVRRATLRFPIWVLVAAAVGWLPGGVIFPAMLAWLAPSIDLEVFVHFGLSFAMSGLIAVAYSFGGMQYVVMRALYPRMWVCGTDLQQTAAAELAGTPWRLAFIELAAYAVPFVANMLIVAALSFDHGGGISLATLVLLLSALGLAGTLVVRLATSVMRRIYSSLTGGP